MSDIVATFKYSLSVLRTLDQVVLGHIIDSHRVRNNIDEIKFEDDLRATGLYHWNGRFLCDAISQRLFAIKLRNEEPTAFGTYCNQAQHICVQRLNDHKVQNPEKWVVEHLFQYLQSQTEKIRQSQNRQQIKHDFFCTIVTEAVAMYIVTRNVQKSGWRTERQVLINEIEKDWEFQFTVNYYLREEKYNDQPFRQLIECIETTQI